MVEGVFDWVRDRLASVLKVDATSIEPSTDLDSLGADSLDLVEVTTRAEHQFGVTILDDELYGLATVGELVALIEDRMPG